MYASFHLARWEHAKRILLRVAVSVILRSQAAAASTAPEDQYRVGVCHLNANFFSCMSSYYPGVTLVIIALCPLVFWVMRRRHRMR